MGLMHGGANLFEDVDYPFQRQSPLFAEHIAERAAVEVLHYQIRDRLAARLRETKVRDVNHVGMTQTPGGSRLAFEALDKLLVAHELGRDQFEGDVAFRAQVRGQVNCPHTTLAEQTLQAVLVVKHAIDVILQTNHCGLCYIGNG